MPTESQVVMNTDDPGLNNAADIVAETPVVMETPEATEPAATMDPAVAAITKTLPIEPDAGMPNEFALVAPGIPNTDRLLGLQGTEWVPDSYFDDAVFIGDSVSMKLNYYVTNARKTQPNLLGNAQFLTVTSFGIRNALKPVTSTSVHPTYQGQKMKVEDIVAAMGAKKVFIMLGMNDVGIYGYERTAEKMIELLYQIKQKSPDVQIFVQSATPRLSGSNPTTEELFMYNVKLYEKIVELKGYDVYFLDVAYIMRDENGKLPEEYCSDPEKMALHFNNAACKMWVDFLYTHALPGQYDVTNV